MPALQYPFDPTGLASTNLITGEQHAVTDANFRDYFFIIPKFAPFFLSDAILTYSDGVSVRELVPDIDYYPALQYVAAVRQVGQPVYGAFTLTNTIRSGIVSLQYRTLGGTWTADRQYILERLTEMVYNPRLTLWDNVTNVQETFPPINHGQEYGDFYGQKELIDAVLGIATQIATGDNANVGIVRHLALRGNPHDTQKSDVGLGQVVDLPLATDDQAIAGTEDNGYITPRTLRVGLTALLGSLDGVNDSYKGPLKAVKDELMLLIDNTNQQTTQLTQDINTVQYNTGLSIGQAMTALQTAQQSSAQTAQGLSNLAHAFDLLALQVQELSEGGFNRTYQITTNTATVAEGGSVVCTVMTTNVVNNTTLYWTVNHGTTSNADLSTLSGSVTVFANSATFAIDTILDSSLEIDESFTVALRTLSVNGTVVATSPTVVITNVLNNATYAMATLSNSVKKGTALAVDVATSGVVNGTTLYWTIVHLSTSAASFVNNNGSMVIANNQQSFNVTLKPLLQNEANQLFKVQLRLESITGAVVTETPPLMITSSVTMIDYFTTCCLMAGTLPISPRSLFVVGSRR